MLAVFGRSPRSGQRPAVVPILPAGIAISWVSAPTPVTKSSGQTIARLLAALAGQSELPTERRAPSHLISSSIFGEDHARWWRIRMIAVLAAPRDPGRGPAAVPILQPELQYPGFGRKRLSHEIIRPNRCAPTDGHSPGQSELSDRTPCTLVVWFHTVVSAKITRAGGTFGCWQFWSFPAFPAEAGGRSDPASRNCVSWVSATSPDKRKHSSKPLRA